MHMRTAKLSIIACALVIMATAHAQAPPRPDSDSRAAEVALSDGTLQLRYFSEGAKVGVDQGSLSLGAFMGEERDLVLTGGVLVPVDFNLGRLSVSLGPQAYAALLQEENSDVFALALGMQARYLLARERNMAVVGSAYYSPDVTTFGSADNITDLEARLEMRVTRSIVGFAGYRWFELDLLDTRQRKLQEEIFIGGRWLFD
jgi:hypothetical protein